MVVKFCKDFGDNNFFSRADQSRFESKVEPAPCGFYNKKIINGNWHLYKVCVVIEKWRKSFLYWTYFLQNGSLFVNKTNEFYTKYCIMGSYKTANNNFGLAQICVDDHPREDINLFDILCNNFERSWKYWKLKCIKILAYSLTFIISIGSIWAYRFKIAPQDFYTKCVVNFSLSHLIYLLVWPS